MNYSLCILRACGIRPNAPIRCFTHLRVTVGRVTGCKEVSVGSTFF